MSLMDSLFGTNAAPGSDAAQAPSAFDPRMAIARALAGGMGGGSGAPANSFAGGMSQGMNPMLQQLALQRMMQNRPVQRVNADMAPLSPMAMQPIGQ